METSLMLTLIPSLMCLFVLKHFICDFLLQTRYQVQHKGTYGHLGGIIHSGIHFIGTFLILVPLVMYSGMTLIVALLLSLLDFVIHYHVDWAKMNINAHMGWSYEDVEFWMLLGLDQLLHSLTYILIILLII